MADGASWSIRLTSEALGEIEQTVALLRGQDRTLAQVTPADFQRPACHALACQIYDQLYGGCGFILVKGLPVARLGESGSAMFFWGMGSLLGRPLPQNARGDRLYEIQDERSSAALVLSSKTNTALPWHTDSGSGAFANAVPDIFGLCAIRTSLSGGTSHLMSSHTLYNQLLQRYPEALDRLLQPFYFDRSLQTQADQEPFARTAIFEQVDSMLGMRYNRQRIERGYALAQAPMEDEDEDALDCIDELLHEPELALRFDFEVGDALFMNNRILLHNRTEFVDGATPDKKRLLYRLWIQKTHDPRAQAAGDVTASS